MTKIKKAPAYGGYFFLLGWLLGMGKDPDNGPNTRYNHNDGINGDGQLIFGYIEPEKMLTNEIQD